MHKRNPCRGGGVFGKGSKPVAASIVPAAQSPATQIKPYGLAVMYAYTQKRGGMHIGIAAQH